MSSTSRKIDVLFVCKKLRRLNNRMDNAENNVLDAEIQQYSGNIKPEFIAKALKMYQKYKSDKAELNKRVVANNKWYKSNYSQTINPKSNETEPATSFIFSAIENKYADAIDNFPVPNLLEREPSDAQTAKILSKIIPVQLDMSGYKKVYKDNWRRKLKYGTAIYGVFYNDEKEDIDVRAIDILNIYCDMHIKDVQDSQFLFIVTAVDNDVLSMQYPKYRALFRGNASIETYSGRHDIDDRTEITDCYYKKADGTLHMIKFAGSTVIDATEDTEGYDGGLYAHGKYPVIFDTLYPEEDCPFGFGVVDTIRNPQMYIDKLDGIIIKNAIISGKTRWIIKDNGGINEKEFMDLSRDVIHSANDVGETSIRAVQAQGLASYVLEHRKEKINELKEVVGNRDFQQGATSSGVTAANAITALQQAGEKLSRTMIDDSYDVYKQLIIMCIELIREFYTEERIYRITNDIGETEFASFSNAQLYNINTEKDALGFPVSTEYKRVEFDIDVVPQRQNPFSRETNNQTLMSLWNSGFFLPQNFDTSVIALQAMNFDGRDKLIENIKKLQQQQQAMQQMQQQDELVPVGQYGDGENSDDELVPVGQYNGGDM